MSHSSAKAPTFIRPLLIILAFGTAGLTLRYHQVEPSNAPNLSAIPHQFDIFRGVEQRFSDETYDILRADTTTLRRYQDPEGTIYWLFVAYFSDQKYGSQIHSPRHCLPGGGWLIERSRDFPIRADNGFSVNATELIIARENQRQVMLYWFESRSGAIRGEFALKFDLVKNALMFRPTDAAFVRLTVLPPDSDLAEAEQNGVRFITAIAPFLKDALPFRK